MTEDWIALREMPGKGSGATFLREISGFAAQRLMELEVDEMTGAAYAGRPGAVQCLPRPRLADAGRHY